MSRLVVTVACFGLLAVTPAAAQQAASAATARQAATSTCSAAYYSALEPLRSGRGAALANLHRALRTRDSELPGKWQVSASPAGKPKAAPKPERVCVETKDLPGRGPRCIRYETKQPEVPPDVVAKLAPTADEARILKPIGDFVEAKGALPDVGNNGRHNFLLARLAQDIRLYASQPEHPNLCAGSADLIEFYTAQAAPFKRRMEEVAALAKQSKDLAAARVRTISVIEMRLYDKAVADAAKVEEQRAKLTEAHKTALAKAAETAAAAPAGATPATPPREPTLPAVPALPPKPNGPAQVQDYLVVSLEALVSEALRPLLPVETVLKIVEERVPVKLFVRARAALLDPQTPASTANSEVKDAALMALRLLEARLYGDLYVARFKELDSALFGSLADLKAAQTASCTCKE